jgi:hypothetical protein
LGGGGWGVGQEQGRQERGRGGREGDPEGAGEVVGEPGGGLRGLACDQRGRLADAAVALVLDERPRLVCSRSVAELAPHRCGRPGGDDVGGDDPEDVAEAAEVAGDHRQCGGQDRLV